MIVVLDTNVLVSGIFWGGVPYSVLELWMQDRIQVIATEGILEEYCRVLKEIGRKKERFQLANSWCLFIAQYTALVDDANNFNICRDPNDNMFLNCAVTGAARYIVSGDSDLLSIGEFMRIKIVTPDSFLQIYHA